MDLKDDYTKTALLITVLITTVVSLYLSRSLFNLNSNHTKPFLCATSLASATSSYYFLRNSHVYRHYSLSSHDSQTLTLLSLLLLHAAALSLSSPAPVVVKRFRIDCYTMLVLTLEYAIVVFYWMNKNLFDDVAGVAMLLSLSLFLLCFLKLAVPGGVGPTNILVVIAWRAADRVLPCLFMVVFYLCVFVRIVWGEVRNSIRSGDEEAVIARRALLLGLDERDINYRV